MGIKRKGCYGYGKDLTWNKDHSSQIIAKSAEKVLVQGGKVEELVKTHDSLTDFIIHLKVPKNTMLMVGSVQVPNVIRYIACKEGEYITKVMPSKGEVGQFKRANSLTDEFFDSVINQIGSGVWDERIHTKNKSVYDIRTSQIGKGFKFKLCTTLTDVCLGDIDHDYYIAEVKKLTEKFN